MARLAARPLAVAALLLAALPDLLPRGPCCLAALTYTDLSELAPSDSLADAFKVSLVRPPDEPANSGSKALVNLSSVHLLEDSERAVLDAYDELFEKYSMFCNGRWLGAQILQDSQDLMYLQHITFMKKPDVIIETGTYKGGATYFFASILDWIDASSRGQDMMNPQGNAAVISVDRHHPDMVFAANWFCPVCSDCIKPYATDVWQRRVRFVQGLADQEPTYHQILEHLFDLGLLFDGPDDTGLQTDDSKTVMVNLDANHEYDGLLRELVFYAPFVSENSYLVVQDTKLDKIWGTAGPTAALNRFLQMAPEGEFVIEPELQFHAYSQHTYLRRARKTVGHTYFLELIQRMVQELQQ